MHILVIFTGGTIGSSLQEGWISPTASSKQKLFDDFFAAEKEERVRFSTASPYEILSENLSAKDISALVRFIEEVDEKDYDGIVVTHGTDTLQYTAAALGFCLTKNLPVLLVSAAYPLEDERSNGRENFRAAVRFIAQKPQAGVYVSYQNQGSKTADIHLATRLFAHAECSADVYSLGGAFASVDNQKKAVFAHLPPLKPVHGVGKVAFCDTPGILYTHCYPEKNYPLDIEKYRAVILAPYHSGTLNTAGKAFQKFCQKAKEAGVPIFVPDCLNGATYESAKAFEELGVTPLSTTKIALFIKCWLALSLDKKSAEEIREFLLRPLANEFLD